jgi:hypothetical protein
MGKRQRKRAKGGGTSGTGSAPAATSGYTDPEGNVLTLRDSVSAGTARKLRDIDAQPAASADDRWQRREELLFERFAVRWEIAGLPLEGQRELLGRYRMADGDTRRWVRATLEAHVRDKQPELAADRPG